ncbi:MAG: hypothetical protein OEZ10_11570 [Gammaproteobacteria bacterium]|nr:hypothetical protein [Gammaproteobacteria bacterium]
MTATVANLVTRPHVACTQCKSVVFDGVALKSRVVRILPAGTAEAKCRQCKGWVKVPVVYQR